jgi:hypothetical protein
MRSNMMVAGPNVPAFSRGRKKRAVGELHDRELSAAALTAGSLEALAVLRALQTANQPAS